jgi:hypothetical protein
MCVSNALYLLHIVDVARVHGASIVGWRHDAPGICHAAQRLEDDWDFSKVGHPQLPTRCFFNMNVLLILMFFIML